MRKYILLILLTISYLNGASAQEYKHFKVKMSKTISFIDPLNPREYQPKYGKYQIHPIRMSPYKELKEKIEARLEGKLFIGQELQIETGFNIAGEFVFCRFLVYGRSMMYALTEQDFLDVYNMVMDTKYPEGLFGKTLIDATDPSESIFYDDIRFQLTIDRPPHYNDILDTITLSRIEGDKVIALQEDKIGELSSLTNACLKDSSYLYKGIVNFEEPYREEAITWIYMRDGKKESEEIFYRKIGRDGTVISATKTQEIPRIKKIPIKEGCLTVLWDSIGSMNKGYVTDRNT